ncbi:LysM peptidoglycan-binding domain-containing protein [Virgibacillus halodenitrificans]|uniref:LysM peptidoglycan-binding domain-containing protein n=1 Tax=Virgibacillus halodenitrificans TaxID=1482 RepID=UPI000EF53BDC|nr:LysM peptidoglycan-binding domain-containing protein [Virgibacillus halodenitrificans]
MAMKTSQTGVDLIKSFEGLRLTAYYDSGGVLTIGYGHTNNTASADRYPVHPGQTITKAQAETILKADLITFENAVNSYVTYSINQNQFDALVSFSFNVGIGALRTSTLLSKLNAGDIQGAANEFGRWVYDNGVKLNGLVRRRKAEKELFLGDYNGGGDSGGGSTENTYTVQSGDTLSHIAIKFNVTVSQLKQWNNLSSDTIRVGQVLIVKEPSGGGDSGGGSTENTYTVQSGDTLSHIAIKFNVTVSQLKQWNNLSSDTIRVGQVLIVKEPSGGGDSGGGSQTTYTVQSGDTLSHIAIKFDVTVSQLKQWNNLSSDTIRVGQVLIVKEPSGGGDSGGGSQTTYTVQSGDTLSHIAIKFDVTVSQLKQWNNLSSDTIRVGQVLVVAPPQTYTVQSGDTLSHIAIKFNVTVSQLKQWNNLSSDTIRVGQVLRVA